MDSIARNIGLRGERLLSADNTGPRLAIDESSLSNGKVYTFVANRDAHTRERGLVAVVAGTKPEDTVEVLRMTGEDRRDMVEEVALDLSGSMRKTVRTAFPKASRAIDLFHIQKLACGAVQGLRIRHRRVAIRQSNDEMEEAKLDGTPYAPFRCSNGDTRKELPIRSRHLLFNSADNWTGGQKGRATILFDGCPDIKEAYGPCHSLCVIFSKDTIKDAARLSMARWYDKVEKTGLHSSNVIAATFYKHYDEILNFCNNRPSDALAESFNAKIKPFRTNLRGVADKIFSLRNRPAFCLPTLKSYRAGKSREEN